MAKRKPYLSEQKATKSLMKALEIARNANVTDEMLKEQRISFAFGNAMNLEGITKDSVRTSSNSIRLRAQQG